jgi:uncharacterized protein
VAYPRGPASPELCSMFILLPPSEGKTVPTSADANLPDAETVALGSLALPALEATRFRLVTAVEGLCSGPPDAAAAALGLSPGQRGVLAHNRVLRTAPTAEAANLYTGVLFDALDVAGLRTTQPAAYRQAVESILVFSALWGVLRLDDRIPYYRCSAGVTLPGIGSVTTQWRQELAGPLAELFGDQLVVDLRSTAYAAMWRGGGEHVVGVRVLQERLISGRPKRTVVSHFNKAAKGRLVRALLVAGAEPKTAGEFAGAVRELGFTLEAGAAPGAFDLVVSEL